MSAHYIRDKRSPKPSSKTISKVMSANKAKDTKPELKLRKALWNEGLKGYRLNWKHVPGRPDIAFDGRKIAIFIHGCYRHRCPESDLPLPKSTRMIETIRDVDQSPLNKDLLDTLILLFVHKLPPN